MKPRTLFAIALAAVAVGVIFLRDPGFGDDFTYWSFAFDLHERGLDAWQKSSFHDLRWPVWLPIWVLQSLGLTGLAAYYLPPLLYLGAGAILAACLARRLSNSAAMAWAAGLAFALHPLLDSICFRPMPDLSEGVIGAAAVAAWWRLMHAASRGRMWLWAALVGALVFVAESNRLTGVFIAGVLGLNTLLFFRQNLGRLALAGAFAMLFYAGECCFYQWLFGDWLHNLHANLGGKGRKGTGSVNLLAMPFRFLDSLWKGGPLAPIYCIAGLAGMFLAWRRHGTFGKVIVVWFWALYFAYACAPQQLWPWRPLLRDADRFLAGLAVPGAILAVLGCTEALRFLFTRKPRLAAMISMRPVTASVLALLAVLILCERERFDLDAVPALRAKIAATPRSSRIFTHEEVRHYAILAAGSPALELKWRVFPDILLFDPKQEQAAAGCDELWYIQKLLWYRTRKNAESAKINTLPKLASFLDEPESRWRITQVITKGDTPDFVFMRSRKPSDPPPAIITAASADMAGILPSAPFDFNPKDSKKIMFPLRPIPASLRGKILYVEMTGSSDHVEAVQSRLLAYAGDGMRAEYLLKPYWFEKGGKFLLAVPIPADATEFTGDVTLHKSTKFFRLDSFRAFVITPE